MAAVSRAMLLDCGTATSSGTTPLAACRRGNWPRRETMVAVPVNPSRRAPIRASTIVKPEPISAIDFAFISRLCGKDLIGRERATCRRVLHAISGGQHDNIGAQCCRFLRTNDELTAATAARNSRVVDDPGVDVGSAFNGLEQTLPHIGAEQLPRQKAVSETFVQAGIVFALIELRERPVQEILGAIRQNREVARSHVEKMQRMMTAKGGTPPQSRAWLDNGEVERTLKPLQAGDRRRGTGKAAADHANIWAHAIHCVPKTG